MQILLSVNIILSTAKKCIKSLKRSKYSIGIPTLGIESGIVAPTPLQKFHEFAYNYLKSHCIIVNYFFNMFFLNSF